MFKPYWTEELTTNGLQAGKIIQGCLRINPKNFEHSFVIHPSKNADVFICGMTARNRALHGDSVAVAIKPRKDWRVFDEYLSDPDNSIDENHVSSAKGVNQRQVYITLADVKEKHKELWEKLIVSDTFDLESNADPNETEVASSWSQYLQRTGEVVAIVKKLHTRKCVGCLRSPNSNGGVHPTTTLFDPVDSRIPRLNISRSCWPQDFSKCPDRFKNTKFVAKIVEWSENGPCAKGELIETLENMDLVDLLTKEILITAGLKSSPDFSEAVLTDVEQCKVDISEEEINLRQDFRDYCIFTIDPSSARDLDDAIHFRRLSDGNVELGVHIADVSHYVQPNSELDKEAADRATTVYLVDRIIPMLPRKLCEQLCTLTPGQDKLAFSVVWVMQPENAQIVSMRFYRSVIRSCAKLSYYDAQACLDAPNKTFHEDEFPKVEAPFTVSLIRDTILDIALITRQLRLRRVEDGALRLQNPKLSFKLSETNKAPVGFEIYQLSEANWLIEELMLLANMSVAKALMDYVPGEALLRRHEPPDSRVLNGALRLLNRLGYHVNGSSSKALQNSITRISEEIRKSYSTESRSIGTMQLLVNWCSKSMKNAEYICASLCSNDVHKCHHYALNAPFYTHFTSPIRRYADVIVHRQLASILPVLNGEQEPHLDDGSAVMWVSERANWCNMMKKAAKEASEKSSELYFSIFVKECGPLTEDCLVFNVLDRSFDVIIISCGFIKRVYCELLDFKSQSCGDVKGKEEILKSLENLDIDSTPQDSSSGTLITSQSAFREMTIQWPLTDDCTHKLEQSIKCQDLVNCSISCKIVNDNYKLTVILNRPKCTLCDAL